MEEKKPSTAMGLPAILREALKLPFRNGKLAVSIALLLLIPTSLLFLANNFTLQPFIFDLTMKLVLMHDKDPQSREYSKLLTGIKKDIGVIIGEELVYLIASVVISVFTMIATIYASSAAYAGKNLTLKELFLAIRKIWKKPAITWLCTTFLINIAYLCLAILVGFVFVLGHGSVISIAFGVILAVFALLFSFYLSAIWMLGLVISVVEEGFYGFRVLKKARKLIHGRSLEGFLLSLVSFVVSTAMSPLIAVHKGDANHAVVVLLLRGLVYINIIGLVSLCNWVVYTVFYYECKKSQGEEVEVKGDNGYSLVPSKVPLDEDIP